MTVTKSQFRDSYPKPMSHSTYDDKFFHITKALNAIYEALLPLLPDVAVTAEKPFRTAGRWYCIVTPDHAFAPVRSQEDAENRARNLRRNQPNLPVRVETLYGVDAGPEKVWDSLFKQAVLENEKLRDKYGKEKLREELACENEKLREELAASKAEGTRWEARVKELEARQEEMRRIVK